MKKKKKQLNISIKKFKKLEIKLKYKHARHILLNQEKRENKLFLFILAYIFFS